MPTIFESYNGLKEELKKAGIKDFVFEAKQIIKSVTGLNNTQILNSYQNKLSEYEEINLKAITVQRKNRYPLQYILGHWDFYGRRFKLGVGALIPRQDTETLIEACLNILKGRGATTVLDLCAGTGCIGITLALEQAGSKVTLLEKYEEAARYARQNIKDLKANNAVLCLGDVLSGDLSDKKYDLIVSNPPYITKEEMSALEPELYFEPETALLGGDDGLDFYRAISKNYKAALNQNGALVFEIGAKQAEAVCEILKSEGFNNITVLKDYADNDRVVFGTVKSV